MRLRRLAIVGALILPSLGAGVAGDLIRLTTDGKDKQRPAWSPNGKRLAFARHETGGTHIWQYVMDVGSPSSARRVTKRAGPEYDGVFTPDGTKLLLTTVTLSGTQGNLDIASVGAEGGDTKPLVGDVTNKLAHSEWASPSPDGARFAFSSTHDGNQEIYTAKIDGTDLVRVTQSPGVDAHPCWTPDGKAIVFATDRWSGLELARCLPDGTGVVRLTHSLGLDDYPAVSPDGSRLAFVSNRDGNYEIYVTKIDGSSPTNLSGDPERDTMPCWTPDGTGVTFVSRRDGVADIYTRRVDRENSTRAKN